MVICQSSHRKIYTGSVTLDKLPNLSEPYLYDIVSNQPVKRKFTIMINIV